MGSLIQLLLRLTPQEINKNMCNHNTESLILSCSHTKFLNIIRILWWTLLLSQFIIFVMWTLKIIIHHNGIITWEGSLLILYIIFGTFSTLCLINAIQIYRLEERRKKYFEAVADAEEIWQEYVIEVSESSEIIKDMESKCQDLKGSKSKPYIYPKMLANAKQTSLPSYDNWMYQNNCQIQEKPPPYQY